MYMQSSEPPSRTFCDRVHTRTSSYCTTVGYRKVIYPSSRRNTIFMLRHPVVKLVYQSSLLQACP